MRRLLSAMSAVLSLTIFILAGNVLPAKAHGRPSTDRLHVSVTKAPIVPDGTTASAVTDLVVTFRNPDPRVPGVGLRAGGTVSVTLPTGFVNEGTAPFQNFATPGCAPPLVVSCNTALLLQGWPQSPRPPFPAITWDSTSRTLTATATADWAPNGVQAPGPKQVHLLLLGFRNPDVAGRYPIHVRIKPDPAAEDVRSGTGYVRIKPRTRPSIEVTSIVNGAPPPPFPNSIYQTAQVGEPLLTYGFYVWARNGTAEVGARLRMIDRRHGFLVDADDRKIGRVRIVAPRQATDFEIVSTAPAAAVPAFISGVPAALLTATLRPDPAALGRYSVTFNRFGGNSQTMHVKVMPNN